MERRYPNQEYIEELSQDIKEDPGLWAPKYYPVDMECASTINATATGSITLDNLPFLMQRATHGILEDMNLAPVFFQDGMYMLNIRDDTHSFQKAPIQADLLLGSIRSGIIVPFLVPVMYEGSNTLSVDLQNLVDRTAAGATFKVQVVFHGQERLRRKR